MSKENFSNLQDNSVENEMTENQNNIEITTQFEDASGDGGEAESADNESDDNGIALASSGPTTDQGMNEHNGPVVDDNTSDETVEDPEPIVDTEEEISIPAKKPEFAKEKDEEKKEDEKSSDEKPSDEEEKEASNEDKEDEEKKKDKTKNFSVSEEEYAALKADYAALNEEVIALRQFKAEVENTKKDELINSFYMLSDEDKAEVVANKANYSLEDIEAKLSVICVRKKVNFNINEEESEAAPMIYNLDSHETELLPAWLKAVKDNREM